MYLNVLLCHVIVIVLSNNKAMEDKSYYMLVSVINEISFVAVSLYKVFMLRHGLAVENLKTTDLDVSAFRHVCIRILV